MSEGKKQDKKTDAGASKKDKEENKVYGALAYIGILFLIPLLVAPKSKFAKFHANQGCVLFIAEAIFGFMWKMPVLGWFVGFFGGIFAFILAIMGLINALNRKMEKSPLIGDIEILK